MKSHRIVSTSTAAMLLAAFATLSSQAATLYWDTNGDTAGLGGTGVWDTTTANWNVLAGTGTPSVWSNTTNAADLAEFRGGDGGVVTIDAGGVTAAGLVTDQVATGAYTFQGGPLTLTGTTLFNGKSGGNITLSSNIVVNNATVTGTQSFAIQTNQANTLTIDGNITFAPNAGASGIKTIQLRGTHADSVVIFNGTLGGSPGGTATTRLQINGVSTSRHYINGDNALATAGAQVVNGITLLGHDNALGGGTAQLTNSGTAGNGTASILTNGARTIATGISVGKTGDATTQVIIGGGTADVSEFSGTIAAGNSASSNLRLSAVSGGRVNFSGNITGTGGTGLLIKQGAGVVALTRDAGITFARNVSVDEGALVLANTTGSATGTGTVAVAANAILGGTGFSTGAITASAATSRFSAGDMTQAGVSSLGTLNLTGGLTAASGATFDFDIDGASVDSINFGAGAVDIDGTATFNFTSLGSVLTDTSYSLFAGTGDWSSISASFVINAPAGYSLSSTYGGGLGYAFDADNHSLTVQFSAIPEPSSIALLGGAAVLGFAAVRRRRAAR